MNTKMVDISVIIPVYRPGNEFSRCVNSLKHQVLNTEKFECIFILNGEVEPYENFLRQCISVLNNAKYFYIEERGVSRARNYGIQMAIGKYITFLDADDWFSDNYLASLLIETNNTKKLVLANVACYNDKTCEFTTDFLGNNYDKLENGKVYSHLKTKSYFSVPWGKLIPSELCKKFEFNEKIEYGEDALFMFSIEPFLAKSKKSTQNATYYRLFSPNSLSNKRRGFYEILKIHLYLIKEYWKIYLKNIFRYDLLFFINRNMAILKHILKGS